MLRRADWPAKADERDSGGDDEAAQLRRAFMVWLKIGCINFGGPAGQIALMHRVVVDEKK
jgi:chromate transporter